MAEMHVDSQRRRLTVARCDPAAGSARRAAAGQNTDFDGRVFKPGLSKLLPIREGSKCVSISSATDADLHRRKSFACKDEVFTHDDSDTSDLQDWVSTFNIGWCCKKGLKPESPNQDSFRVVKVEDEFALYSVFDGHGPHGHHISHIVSEKLVELFLRHNCSSGDTSRAYLEAFSECQALIADKKLLADTMEQLGYSGVPVDPTMSGTTATMVHHDLKKDLLTIAHVGDSRAVLGAVTAGDMTPVVAHVEELTEDHKPELPSEKKRIESSNPPGRVLFDGYFNHRVFSHKGMYPGLNMSRALGDVCGHEEAGLSAEPDVKEIDLKQLKAEHSGTFVLLVCTDGVWEFIKSEEALNLVADAENPEVGMHKLAKEGYSRWMEDSNDEISDDITGILVHLS